jgi:hypothetical protein
LLNDIADERKEKKPEKFFFFSKIFFSLKDKQARPKMAKPLPLGVLTPTQPAQRAPGPA